MKKYLLIILIPFLAFTFTGNPPGGWYQQTLPDLNSEPISDIFVVDSLKGFAVTGDGLPNDTNFILRTTNGGDNWNIVYTAYRDFFKVVFINSTTGFVCGGYNVISGTLLKTTNGGDTWFNINTPGSVWYDDMSILNEDTIWLVQRSSFDGGVFRTTNGGVSWDQQLHIGSQNPDHIYFYDKDTGFAASTVLYRTTNSGINWIQVANGTGFGDMYFINATTGWKCYGPIQKTTDGGLNWQTLTLPPKGGNIVLSRINRMQVLNEDTIWGVGSVGIVNSVGRGFIYLTTNGGLNWGYQVPDTSINIFQYNHIQFVNNNIGWAYAGSGGVHTVKGGDTTVYLGVSQIGSEIPSEYKLYQNYPNPFNPTTSIKFKIKSSNNVKLTVFDIAGRETAVLVNEKLSVGEYEYRFDGTGLPSGVYFYRLIVENAVIDTKKMMLIK